MTAATTRPVGQTVVTSRWQQLRHEVRRNPLPYLLLAPLVIILLVFLVFPFVSLFYYGLRQTDLSGASTFVGLKNFTILLNQSRFGQNVAATVIYLVGNLAISVPLAYFAAVLISTNRRGVGVLRTLFLIPWVLAPIVTAVLFKTLMNPSSGPITMLLRAIFGHPVYLMLSEDGGRVLIILHAAWRSFPLEMLLIAAGMTAIPLELYEAARVDGAGMRTQFRYITLPLTRTPLFTAVLLISVALPSHMGVVTERQKIEGLKGSIAGLAPKAEAVRRFRAAREEEFTPPSLRERALAEGLPL